MSRTIVVAATPTSNGDLHVGHMAGPYLSADIYARYLRAAGRQVIYTTCTDDSQSYVVSTAHRQGTTPARLCARSTEAIQRSLRAMGLSMAGLPPVGEQYRRAVLDFVTALHRAGRFRLTTVRLPVASRSGAFLYDGLVSGTCPVCLAPSCGGGCEGCGHPNNFDQLLDARSTVDPSDPVEYRETAVLVLPLEEYRDRLTAYYASRQGRWRPHAMQLVQELLAKPLPEVPVTVPGDWGIPAPFPETPGQVIYPWIEAMPAVMYSTWWSAAQLAEPAARYDEHWRAEHGAELVYFHGFDNTYHWGLMDLVLLMAHGDRYITPTLNVCNEFYDLAGEKFSTSRNHLIWTADLLAEVPRDLVRFHLALTAPEQARTNFTRDALHDNVSRKLVGPWNGLAGALARAVAGAGDPVPTTAAGRARCAAMLTRFRSCYELPGYSASRAAETVLVQLDRLRGLADDPRTAPGDLLLEVRTVLAGAAPILIDTADRAGAAGVELSLSAGPSDFVPAFDLPRLPGAGPASQETDHEAADHRDPAVPELLPIPLSAGAGVRGRPLRDER
ncbi:MAG TPA: class I tRNA ligase family protein [Actinophytocola sp.]|uniref:class I tRNA ligase family protein n=1 Tax=Actinophytocola sp. TaxID=1872138 RepID=UPI002DBE1A04|nr:class I tRNA ligase family protein [Actinophytocola sp.]HEU5471310.1 class I tRNA ligase family protein [Actinophytocola sp.]